MHVDLCRDCGHRQILSRHKSKQSGTLHQHDPIAQQAVYNQFPYEVRVQQTQRASFGNSTTWRNGPHSVALPTHYPQNQYNPDTLHQATTLNRASGAFGGRPMEQSMGVATEYTHAYHHQVPRVGGRVVTCEIEPRLPMGLSMRNSSDHVSLNHNNTASLTRSSKHAATAKKKIDPAKSAYDVYRFVKRREIVHENGEQGLDHAIDALIHESWEDIGADEQNLYEPRSIISKLVKSKVSAYMFYRAEQHRRLTKQHTFSKIAELVGRQWQTLSESARRKYELLAEEDNARWEKEMKLAQRLMGLTNADMKIVMSSGGKRVGKCLTPVQKRQQASAAGVHRAQQRRVETHATDDDAVVYCEVEHAAKSRSHHRSRTMPDKTSPLLLQPGAPGDRREGT
eukprot:m.903504 g.903504  ORF g.903504 m.903504 type:complete len:397 (-) comp23694_c0_seq36:3574-4764(-)